MNTAATAALDDLRRTPLALGLDDAALGVLAALMSTQTLAAQQLLAAEGSADSRLYAIVDGTLSVVKGLGGTDENVVVTLSAGDLAHELGFIDGAPRHAALVAATPLRVLVLERERLETLIDRHPRVLYAVMCNIVRTVHRVQRKLAVQASELTNYIVKQHGRY